MQIKEANGHINEPELLDLEKMYAAIKNGLEVTVFPYTPENMQKHKEKAKMANNPHLSGLNRKQRRDIKFNRR